MLLRLGRLQAAVHLSKSAAQPCSQDPSIFSKYNNTQYFNIQKNTGTQLLTFSTTKKFRSFQTVSIILPLTVWSRVETTTIMVFHPLINCLCFTSLFCQTVRKYSEDKMTSNYLKRVEAATLLSASWCKVNRRPEKDQHSSKHWHHIVNIYC